MNEEIRVLLVDDESDFRQLMASWLKSKGYSVIEAGDGKSAIQLIKEKKADVVFLDLHMPIMDGAEALKKVRNFNKNIPVIIISAYLDDPLAKEAASHGVSGVFNKGQDFETGLSLLEASLRTHKELKKYKK